MIYLDSAANAKVLKKVLDSYNEASIKYFANPNSSHKLGLEVKNRIDLATKNIAKFLGVKDNEIIYTSGASESNNLVVQGVLNKYKEKGKHVIIGSFEHSSIVAPANKMMSNGFDVDIVKIDENGLINIKAIEELIRDDTILISISLVDSELGIIQNIDEIGSFLKEKYPNIILHTDASQGISKTNFNFKNVDLVTIAPHKFGGLNGIGILIKKENINLEPIIYGGKSTTIFRSGTPNAPMIISLEKAFEISLNNYKKYKDYIKKLHDHAINKLKNIECIKLNSNDYSINNTINFSVLGFEGKDIQDKLSNKDIFVSTSSACSSDNTYSRVVYNLTNDIERAKSSIRISFTYENTIEELDEFFKKLTNIIEESNEE